MDEVQIRPATNNDIEAIAEVTQLAYAEYVGRLAPPSGVFNEQPANVARALEHGGIIVAEAGGTVIGAVRYESHVDHVYLGRLAVVLEWRGRGIGRRLIEAVEAWTVLLGMDEVRLGVRTELAGNRDLYLRLGYEEAGLAPFDRDPQYSYLQMRKQLDQQ